jgi:hypothetical protein
MLSTEQLEIVKSKMEAGNTIPMILEEENMGEHHPGTVRRQLFDLYGEKVMKDVIENKMNASNPEILAESLNKMLEIQFRHPNFSIARANGYIALFQDLIIKIRLKRAELEGRE